METLKDLGKEYALRFERLSPYREKVWKSLTAHFFQPLIPETGTVLDLGCGWGEFIRNIKAGRKLAMDLNPDAPRRVGPGVEMISQDCSQPWAVEPGTVDVIFTSNFFEHLPDKDALRRTLVNAHAALAPNGRIICLGPNIRFLHGTYWDFWDHYLPLTDRTMLEGLTLTGFAVERCEPQFLPYSMSQGITPPVALIEWYLKFPFLWRFLGKQFLVIARKSEA